MEEPLPWRGVPRGFEGDDSARGGGAPRPLAGVGETDVAAFWRLGTFLAPSWKLPGCNELADWLVDCWDKLDELLDGLRRFSPWPATNETSNGEDG